MKKLLVYSLAIVFFASCSKDDKTCNLDAASVSGTYKITAVRYKATPASAEADYYNQFFTDVCERDDTHILNANGTYVFTDAGVQCSPPDSFTSTWSLTGNTITVDGETYNIDSFNCSTTTISFSGAIIAGDKAILVLTRQ